MLEAFKLRSGYFRLEWAVMKKFMIQNFNKFPFQVN